MSQKINLITEEEKLSLEQQLEHLKLVKRQEVIERIKIARSYGDLSENSEYEAAKEEQRQVNIEIDRIENYLRNIKIIDVDSLDENSVSIGKTVKVYMGDTNTEEVYSIVGNTNINVLENRVGLEAPFGSAINHKQKGDMVIVQSPAGDYEVTIIDIIKTPAKK